MTTDKNELVYGWHKFGFSEAGESLPPTDVPVFVTNGNGIFTAVRRVEGEGWYWDGLGMCGGDLSDSDSYDDGDDNEWKYWQPMLKTPEAI